MLTRRAASMEEKLRATLKELEATKSLCNDLLQEREDSEVELKKVIDRNTELKNELSELHIQHMDIHNQHQQLCQIVTDYQQCMDTHEISLRRISELELELNEAYKSITLLESQKNTEQAINTCSLYNELVGSVSGSGCDEQPIIIDLTESDSYSKCTVFNSHNKLKKYIRINRLIKKYQKSVVKLNMNKLNLGLRKQKNQLRNQLKQSSCDLELCSFTYDTEIHSLQEQLLEKEKSLRAIFDKFVSSQKDLQERMVEAGELADLVKYNAERYESLTNNLCCTCSGSLLPCESQTQTETPVVIQLNEKHLTNNSDLIVNNTSFVFTDKRRGQGLGRLINSYSQHSITNFCVPGASLNILMESMSLFPLNSNCTAVLMHGDSSNVCKKRHN